MIKKHPIASLIVIFLIVLVALPAAYMGLQKFRGGLDRLQDSSKKEQPTSVVSSQNFIPDSGTGKTLNTSYKEIEKDIDLCFKDLKPGHVDALSYKVKENAKATFTNKERNLVWNVIGFDMGPASLATIDRSVVSLELKPSEECTANAEKKAKLEGLFDAYMLAGLLPAKLQASGNGVVSAMAAQYDLTGSGTSIIGGRKQYWYLFEDKDRLTAKSHTEEKRVVVLFLSYRTDRSVVDAFGITGTSTVYGNAREIVGRGETLISGMKYGI